MVKSSIVVPTQTTSSSSTRKRSIDQQDATSDTINDSVGISSSSDQVVDAQESKKPRLAMNADSRRRGQRMFGVLLGTLNKFKDDSKNTSEAEKKRQEIESKTHEKLANEKKELAEKLEADKQRREREAALLRKREERLVEEKRDSTCVKQKEYLANYVKTKAHPALYYRPKKLTDDLAKQIEEQISSARQERTAYEARKAEREKEEEAEDKLAVEAAVKRRDEEEKKKEKNDDEEERPKETKVDGGGGGSVDANRVDGDDNAPVRLESPAPEESVVADRDE
ncbi:pinin/SDK/memA/ protein conserved region-domain-containing protein [Zychaea mexicana]|uniref:pinin/SDK/memA/ protein conserved region-domain-containing protein n=1 Tax=Zychaea mexicana TaxID=64656 RepID=UPI0022FE5462|nr:pinin/SDK/memA/ protein conserved region-domain-containing protein [Zychaea mexicana]KAI9495469.1 pinin/SDK/memA/ protein conserved region-domain-containing protein [Zychaea mexicana]